MDISRSRNIALSDGGSAVHRSLPNLSRSTRNSSQVGPPGVGIQMPNMSSMNRLKYSLGYLHIWGELQYVHGMHSTVCGVHACCAGTHGGACLLVPVCVIKLEDIVFHNKL
eukprot:scaffold194723_cov37-Attheya_sp.AAC.1